jgi:hypothetical protein
MFIKFADEKNVHLVILRSDATPTSGSNSMKKNQRFYLRINTKKTVTSQTVVDV